MLKKSACLSLVFIGLLGLNSCDTMYTTDAHGHKHLSKTAIGAGVGAVGGTVVGAAIGGTQGAVIGAGTGAVAGGLVGNQLDH